MGAPTSSVSDLVASGLTTEWHVMEITTDKDGLETASLHEVCDHEASAIAECERMNYDHGQQSLLGAGDSTTYIVVEEVAS